MVLQRQGTYGMGVRMSNLEFQKHLKKFNWGAFIGGWIWGLINGVYITLIEIPLSCLPPLALLGFAIYCGIKGNEWAWEKWKEDYGEARKEDFVNRQKTQSKVFIIIVIVHLIITIIAIIALYILFAGN